MGPNPIVLSEPCIDDDLCLLRGVEPLGIEDFAAQRAVEALVVSVLTKRSWVDLDRIDPKCPRHL